MKKRTTTRRKRQFLEFIADNRRLFPFVGLFLIGVIGGTVVYRTAGSAAAAAGWSDLLRVTGLTGGLRQGLGALGSVCFSSVLLLVVLFLLGLWGCGAPFILFVPLFQGLGLGLTQAYYYSLGWRGVLAVATVILPYGLLDAIVLTMAGAESLRLSLSLSRRLLPGTASSPDLTGGMWNEFRLYCLRFLLFLLGAIAAGLVDILLRTVFCALLP